VIRTRPEPVVETAMRTEPAQSTQSEVAKSTQPAQSMQAAELLQMETALEVEDIRDGVAEVNFTELFDRDQTIIDLPPQSQTVETAQRPVPVMPPTAPKYEEIDEVNEETDEDATIVMGNGSIRTFNSDRFRVPTFVRKQID